MATLYVENVPDDRYKALRKLAKKIGTSMAAEVLDLLEHFVPTEADLKRRRKFHDKVVNHYQKQEPLTPGPHPSAEEMIREDRER
jgi:plasmid stability protein